LNSGRMRVDIAFGQAALPLDLDPERFDARVLLPHDPPALADPVAAIGAALDAPIGCAPLAAIARARQPRSVAIAIADHTRPVPDHLIVPALVERLGVPDAAVTILIGTGTHRGSTAAEIERILGPAAKRFRVINHDCHDDANLVHVGDSSCGGACWLNRAWVDADLRLATGFIEPHFFAGFSGGTKAVVPGIAGFATVQHFHRAKLIAHPGTTWGDQRANPLQRLTREMTALCPAQFIANVTLDGAKRITGVFAGDATRAHDAGCAAALQEAFVTVERTYPVVVTSNSGYPLDQNFYQTVKGISAAARIVAPGGTILVAAECRAGLPGEGEFGQLLADARGDEALLAEFMATERTRLDQWQVQTLLQCAKKARIILHSRLSPSDRARTRVEHSDDLVATLAELQRAHGARLPIAILPRGPLTIPTLAATARGG